jgi:hypothetical protein
MIDEYISLPLFALLIGMSIYQNPEVFTLEGAVPDADSMQV